MELARLTRLARLFVGLVLLGARSLASPAKGDSYGISLPHALQAHDILGRDSE